MEKVKKLGFKKITVLCLVILMFSFGIYFGGRKLSGYGLNDIPSTDPQAAARAEIYPYELKKNKTAFDILQEAGLTGFDIHQIVENTKPHFNLNKLRAGTKYQLFREPEPSKELRGITFKF